MSMRSWLVWRDLEADVVSPEWGRAFREVKFMLLSSPAIGMLFLQFLPSPLVLEALPVFWIPAI